MKDSDQSKYLRWGIPGWMMFISFFGFLLIDVLFSQESNKNEFYIFITQTAQQTVEFSSVSAAVVGLLIAAAGIPLGFLIYQVYFYIRWTSPFSRDGLFPPFVVGRWRDIERTLAGISDSQITGQELWRRDWIAEPQYTNDHGVRWRYVENFFIENIQKINIDPSGGGLYIRYRYLLDLLHTLGAGLFGLYLGYAAYLMAKVKIYNFSPSIMLLIFLFCLIILILLLEIEDKLKRGFQKDEIATGWINIKLDALVKKMPFIQRVNLSVIYLFFWGSFLYLGSPSPYSAVYTEVQLGYRVLILVLPLLIWFFTNNGSTIKLRAVEVSLLLTAGIVAFLLSQHLRGILALDRWSFGWVTFAFLILNMIFIKNRQNTRDDLIALQNYTIKRIVNLGNTPKKRAKKKASSSASVQP